MSIKSYLLYCDNCNYKRITDGSDVQDLKEIKTSPVQTGIARIEPESKILVKEKFKNQPKKFKCPMCGYLVKVRKR